MLGDFVHVIFGDGKRRSEKVRSKKGDREYRWEEYKRSKGRNKGKRDKVSSERWQHKPGKYRTVGHTTIHPDKINRHW